MGKRSGIRVFHDDMPCPQIQTIVLNPRSPLIFLSGFEVGVRFLSSRQHASWICFLKLPSSLCLRRQDLQGFVFKFRFFFFLLKAIEASLSCEVGGEKRWIHTFLKSITT